MGHFVTSHDSDYFIGYCECNQLPCLSCVAAQQKIERAEKLRSVLVTIYYQHHKSWPQGVFIDAIIDAFKCAESSSTEDGELPNG
jgi:hypothetical protein